MKRFHYVFIFILLLAFSISAQTVFITKSGSKYHTSSCSYLKKSSISIELEKAVERGYSACSRCKPSSFKTSQTKEQSNEIKELKQTNKKKTSTTSSRCRATTKKGTQCKRNAAAGSNYCWQHK